MKNYYNIIYMTFFNKYLKYKKKYLNLKNNIQIGRGPPLNNIIKSIGLFDKGSGDENENNFLQVIKNLFDKIKTLDDFNLKLSEDVEQSDDSDVLKPINISSVEDKTIIDINYNGKYKITIGISHYSIESMIKKTDFDYTYLDSNNKFFIDILLDKDNIYDNLNDNFYFIKWEKEELIRTFNNLYNNYGIDKKIYIKIYKYLYDKYKDAPDERSRINFKINFNIFTPPKI